MCEEKTREREASRGILGEEGLLHLFLRRLQAQQVGEGGGLSKEGARWV